MAGLVRLATEHGIVWAALHEDGGVPLGATLAELLALPLDAARARIDAASGDPVQGHLLAPIDAQEVWAAGVTYERSRDERMAESTEASIYDRVYVAERPEVFFKSTAGRSASARTRTGTCRSPSSASSSTPPASCSASCPATT